MRRVITGLDAAGRSVILSDGAAPVAFAVAPDLTLAKVKDTTTLSQPEPGHGTVHELWQLDDRPSALSADPTAVLEVPRFAPAAAHTQWILTQMGPGTFTPMHSTPSIDYAVVVSGAVELGLEAGAVNLVAGDVMLINAVEHSWRAGPAGCVLATVLVGLREEERARASGVNFLRTE